MYEAFYGLREKPFSILPDPDLIYWGRLTAWLFPCSSLACSTTPSLPSSRAKLVRARPPSCAIFCVSSTREDQCRADFEHAHGRDELLQAIMKSLNLPFEGSVAALLRIFEDFLYSQQRAGDAPS